MANRYLDYDGLLYFWQKIKTLLAGKVDTESGKGLSTNDYTTNDKNKLAGIATGAEVNQDAFSIVKVGNVNISADAEQDTLTISAGNNVTLTPTANSKTLQISATDTTYSNATAQAAGLMSASDKAKLDTISEYADETGTIIRSKSGNSTVSSTLTRTHYLEINDSVITYGTGDDNYDHLNINDASASTKGLMSSSDYSKLATVQQNADKTEFYVQGTDDSLVKIVNKGDTIKLVNASASRAELANGTWKTTLTINDASANAKGLMSSTHYSKLEGIAQGAQVNVIETVKVNNSALTPSSKAVNITVPTKVSDLTNDSGFITASDVPEGAAASSTTPKMNGTAAVGTETAFARGDHVHPTDTSRAPLASPTFTGTPAAPTATAGTNTTQIATTAFVSTAISNKAPLASPTFTGTPAAPTATAGTNTTQIATTAFVTTAVANAQVGAAMFQGTVDANTTISNSSYKKGWYWIVHTAGTYVGQTCEVGDMIFAIANKSSNYSASDFSVIQNNMDVRAITNAEIDTILAA